MTKNFIKIVVGSTLIFLFSWLVVDKLGINKLSIQSEDTLPALFLPVTIIEEKTIYLDSFYDVMIKNYPHPNDKDYKLGLVPFYARRIDVNGAIHYLSAFPIITPLLALPVYYLAYLLGVSFTLANVTVLGHLVGALICGLSGGFLYMLLRKHFSCNEKKSMLLTAIYLFATVNYAMISQALWQHGVAELFVILAVWFLYEKKYFWMGLALMLAVLSRPTAMIVLCFMSLLFIEKAFSKDVSFVKKPFKYVVGFIPPISFFMWYTNKFYLGIQNNGYASQILSEWQSKFPEGFLGLWLSPSKGILVYSPILIFALVGFYLAVRNNLWRKNYNHIIFFCIVLTHTLFLGIWKHWYGGWSFGYRMASDVLPFFILLMVPYINSDLFEKTKRLFYMLFVFSILVQIYGIVFFDGIWHAAYDRGYTNTRWLWSIKDSEVAFNVRRILVKLKLLERACPKCLGIHD